MFLNIKIPLYPLGEKGRNDLIKILKAQPIEVLFIPFLLDDHPDHRNTNALLMEISEKSTLNIDAEVWAYQVYTPLPGNMVVDITNQIDQKKVSIEGYASQMRKRNWAHFALGLNAFNTRLLNSSTDERFVEAFFVVPFKDYIDLCRQYFRRT